MARDLTRRRLLAGAAAAGAAGLAGCSAGERAKLNPFREAPVTMTVIVAAGDETDTTCRLPSDVVADIPYFEAPLQELADAADGERIEKGLTIPEGRAVSNLFTRVCDGDVGGLYRYEGSWYLVGLTYRDQADHQDHHDHLANGTSTAQ